MKVTYNWLKDFVEIKIRPEELADKLTMAGLEVTALQKLGEDYVFEIEVTPNRVDCLSIVGIAREVATITNKKLESLGIKSVKSKASKNQDFSIKIEDKIGCPFYSGRLIRDVLVSPSPNWLRQRIEAVGLRPINNIVDITNYCLMELGQPMHAFDYDKLNQTNNAVEIVIRRAKKEEKITNIDGTQRQLDPEVLVIAAGNKNRSNRPVAVAGVMGGLDTEVGSSTQNILLESAYFEPVTIRRGSRLLGVSSESSYRFERGVDTASVLSASDRALKLILELCRGRFISQKFSGKNLVEKKHKVIFSVTQNNKILGTEIKPSDAKRILNNLGFKATSQSKDKLRVEIPSFRRDVTIPIDLTEEVARIFSYDKIKQAIPYIKPTAYEEDSLRKLNAIIKKTLVSQGLNEIISYSLFSQDILSQLNYPHTEIVEIKNPLTRDQEMMRPTLMHGLLSCLAKNLSNRIDTVKVFECGNIYIKSSDYPRQQLTLGVLLSGQAENNWLRKVSPCTLFDLKGLIENLFLRLGIKEFKFEKKDYAFFIKGQSASLRIKEERPVGFMGQVEPQILFRYDIKNKDVFLAEVYLEAINKFINLEKHYRKYSAYPSIKRDLSLVVAENISQEEIASLIQQEAAGYITNIILFDQYLGSQIPSGMRGLAFQLEYQLAERTLTDAEVDAIHKKIIQRLIEALKIQIR